MPPRITRFAPLHPWLSTCAPAGLKSIAPYAGLKDALSPISDRPLGQSPYRIQRNTANIGRNPVALE